MYNPYQPPASDEPPRQPWLTNQGAAPPGPVAREVSALAAIRFVFAQPNWQTNALYGVLMQLIPLAGPLAMAGFFSEVHRRLVWQHPEPVPKFSFDDFGVYLQRGWVTVVAQVVVSLLFILPLIIAPVVYFASQSIAKPAGLMAALLVVSFTPLLLLLPFLLISAVTLAELTESLGTALSLTTNLAYLRRIALRLVLVSLCFVPIAIGILLCGMLVCFVGVYAAVQVLQLANVHLRWQLYNHALSNGAQHVAVKPLSELPSERRYPR